MSEAGLADLRRKIALNPRHPQGWRALGDRLTKLGRLEEADQAYTNSVKASVNDPELIEAAQALVDNRLAVAEPILRQRLKRAPTDIAAIRMLAELAARVGRFTDAETLLRRALELAPGFAAARANLATVLHRQNRPIEAIEVLDRLLDDNPIDAAAQNLKAAALGRIGGYDEAITIYEEVLNRVPNQPKIWMSYGHVLKTVGRQQEGIDAYRRAITIAPTLGEVWWSLANLKTVRLGEDDIAAMSAALEQSSLAAEDRFHLHFALGKALEDAGRPAESFARYAEGNRLRRKQMSYDPHEIHGLVERSRALFTASFVDARRDWGCAAPDPIFVLGMPRAGSTLIEQILASHPLIEGTMELPDIALLARRLGGRKPGDTSYPDGIAGLDAAALAALGEEYLERTRVQRKTERPFFVDKMPNNWLHLGLIHLILPNAKIVDARRHPLGCCFSNFKQHFARGQGFSYSLKELGRYYSDYVRLMRHFDDLLPGRIHRVFYEDMVADPEREVRRLLDYLGVPFDPACLRFYENERAVRTASSEQVRRPINRDGLDQWQQFEPWLGPLKAALGDVLTCYPEAPPC